MQALTIVSSRPAIADLGIQAYQGRRTCPRKLRGCHFSPAEFLSRRTRFEEDMKIRSLCIAFPRMEPSLCFVVKPCDDPRNSSQEGGSQTSYLHNQIKLRADHISTSCKYLKQLIGLTLYPNPIHILVCIYIIYTSSYSYICMCTAPKPSVAA